MEKTRIQKLISESGYCSRRKAEELIEKGVVTINGHKCKLGDKASNKDIIAVNGQRIESAGGYRYIMLYKPRGYITAVTDDRGRKVVIGLLRGVKERVYPIGRLDLNSEGLLLLTNDGNFANMVMHPAKEISKTYRVTVKGRIKEEQLAQMSAGIAIDGKDTLPCVINVLTEESERTVLQFIIKEGRNRQIRKMCEAVNLEVIKLKRTAEGPIKLGMLRPGEFRDLKPEELKAMRRAIGK